MKSPAGTWTLPRRGKGTSPSRHQKLIRYFREGIAEGELCTKIEETVHKVRENDEWRLLYLEEKAYRDYMTRNI